MTELIANAEIKQVILTVLFTIVPLVSIVVVLFNHIRVIISSIDTMREAQTPIRESSVCLLKYCLFVVGKYAVLLLSSSSANGELHITSFQQTICLILELCATYNLVIFLSRLFFIRRTFYRGLQLVLRLLTLMCFCLLPFCLQVELQEVSIMGIDILFLGNSIPVKASLFNEFQTAGYLLCILLTYVTVLYGLKYKFKVSTPSLFTVYVKGLTLLSSVSMNKLFSLPPRRELTLFLLVRVILFSIYVYSTISFLSSINSLIRSGSYRITADKKENV